jgi:DNA-binding transcriptional ArsR family regulator
MRQLWHPDLGQVTLAGALSALGDPVRLSMVLTLQDGQEHLRGDFSVDVGSSTLSHHAKTLREAGIMRSREEGTRCYMSLRPEFAHRFPGLLDVVLAQAAAEAAGNGHRAAHRR